MDVHPLHKTPTSFREFGREYAMIVLSILTALSLERGVVYLHDHATARESRARIEQELGGDLADLRKSIDFNNAHLTGVREALNALEMNLNSSTSDLTKRKQIIEDVLRTQMSLELPTWQREAWDAAVADQSASHLDSSDLRRYAELYTRASDAADATHIVLNGSVFDRLADVQVDLSLNDVDGREAAKLMARFLAAAQQIALMQGELLKSGDDRKKILAN